jgi:hypothetical protein
MFASKVSRESFSRCNKVIPGMGFFCHFPLLISILTWQHKGRCGRFLDHAFKGAPSLKRAAYVLVPVWEQTQGSSRAIRRQILGHPASQTLYVAASRPNSQDSPFATDGTSREGNLIFTTTPLPRPSASDRTGDYLLLFESLVNGFFCFFFFFLIFSTSRRRTPRDTTAHHGS